MANLLAQPPRQLGGQSTPQPMGGQMGQGFDLAQLVQMILSAQTQQQQNTLQAATTPVGKIARDPRGSNWARGLSGWEAQNPHAKPGMTYAQSNQMQQMGIRDQMAQADIQGRLTLADLLGQLGQKQASLYDTAPNPAALTGRYNPFFQ